MEAIVERAPRSVLLVLSFGFLGNDFFGGFGAAVEVEKMVDEGAAGNRADAWRIRLTTFKRPNGCQVSSGDGQMGDLSRGKAPTPINTALMGPSAVSA